MQPDAYASDWLCTWFAKLLPLPQAILLWDTLLLHPPQFQLFVGLCLASLRGDVPVMFADQPSHALSHFLDTNSKESEDIYIYYHYTSLK